MIDERRKRFASYVRDLADRMGLRDWTIYVDEDPPEDARLAACADCVYGRKWITVSLSEAFFRKDEPGQRGTICHELIHAHLAPMHHFLHRTIKDSDWEAYKVAMEYAVDGMATEWAPHLPLPSDIFSPRKTPMGRQRPVKADTAEPKPKARPKGTATPKGKTPKKGS